MRLYTNRQNHQHTRQCELPHAVSVLNSFSFFAGDTRLDNNMGKNTKNVSQIMDQSFSVAKRQEVITIYFS